MKHDRVWIVVLVSGFLGLMVDGMDLMFLSYSLPSLMREFQISKVEAGSLASYTLLGMAVGGLIGGWAADRFGRVRVVVWTIMVFSVGTAGLALTQTYWQFALLRFAPNNHRPAKVGTISQWLVLSYLSDSGRRLPSLVYLLSRS